MLISHRKKFIYTKTQKTASTSVEVYLEKYCLEPGTWKFQEERNETITKAGIIGFRGIKENVGTQIWKNHMSAIRIKELIGDEIWNSYFKFCVIRNPYDKLISAFFHFYVHRNNIILNPKETIPIFHDWLQKEPLKPDRYIYMIKNEICMDYFIRYEYLISDLAILCQKLDLEYLPEKLPSLKSGIKPDWVRKEDFYDKKSAQLVEKLYDFEFEYFQFPRLF